MDIARRKAYIMQQVALKKQQEGQTPKRTGSANPSTKRKQPKKTGYLPKKPKTVPEPIVLLQVEAKKTVTQPGPGKGKGLMTSSITVAKKPPVLLHEDSKYALE